MYTKKNNNPKSMCYTRIFRKNGYFLKLAKEENESIDTFLERGNYIVNMRPQNKEDIDKCSVYSKIWIEKKLHNNEYNHN